MNRKNSPITLMVRMKTILNNILDVLRQKKKFILTTHINPDGDALGSTIALAELLRAMSKDYVVCCRDAFPEGYSFLGHDWTAYSSASIDASQYDVVIAIDSPVKDRLGNAAEILDKVPFLINIDHHPGNDLGGDIDLVDESSAAAGELIYYLYKESGAVFTQVALNALYTAIATDTGSFKYHNTTSQTHKIIADLIDLGVEPGDINTKLYSNMPFKKVQLHGFLSSRIQLAVSGRIGWAFLKSSELKQFDATKDDTDGFVNMLRNIDSVEVCFFAFEDEEKGETKISLRSSGDANVNHIANEFGGGGHARAAGCTISHSAEEASLQVLNRLTREIEGTGV